MSLDFRLGKIADYKELCYEFLPNDGLKMKPVTEALIWSMLSTEMKEITEDNIDEVLFRSRCISVVSGPPMHTYDGEKIIPREFTREEVEAHVGLSTNVTQRTRKQFLKTCSERLERTVEDRLRYEARQKGKKDK
jgi:hypothetical protein